MNIKEDASIHENLAQLAIALLKVFPDAEIGYSFSPNPPDRKGIEGHQILRIKASVYRYEKIYNARFTFSNHELESFNGSMEGLFEHARDTLVFHLNHEIMD